MSGCHQQYDSMTPIDSAPWVTRLPTVNSSQELSSLLSHPHPTTRLAALKTLALTSCRGDAAWTARTRRSCFGGGGVVGRWVGVGFMGISCILVLKMGRSYWEDFFLFFILVVVFF